jgi:hypothetical protein
VHAVSLNLWLKIDFGLTSRQRSPNLFRLVLKFWFVIILLTYCCSDSNNSCCMFQFQYPVSEVGFEFQESLVETLYGLNVWDRLRALVNVLKIVSEYNPTTNLTKKTQ